MADRDAPTDRGRGTTDRDGATPDRDRGATGGERSTVVNALVGAAVTVVLAFVPFTPVLGGAVAGYLQGGDAADGLRVGALSGFIATLPLVLVFVLVGTVFAFVGAAVAVGSVLPLGTLGVDAGGLVAVVVALVLLAFLVSMGYLVALSALGGAVGAYVRGDPGLDPTAE